MADCIGYARVSTPSQNLQLQLDALAGCSRVFTDKAGSSRKARRPGLEAALNFLRRGDTLTVWKLDRLGRSVLELINLLLDLDTRGVHLCSITDKIDTSTSSGRLMFHVLASLAEMERDLILDRTRAGLEAAWASGVKCGRPKAVTPPRIIAKARMLFAAGADARTVAKALGMSPRTLYRRIPESVRQQDFIFQAAAQQIQPK